MVFILYFHRPLTNASSLKITAAYWTGSRSGHTQGRRFCSKVCIEQKRLDVEQERLDREQVRPYSEQERLYIEHKSLDSEQVRPYGRAISEI
jgi:hypothetical protein